MTAPAGRSASPGAKNSHLVLFDGVCGLCDASVQFLLRRDRRQRLIFAPLQGATAAEVLQRSGLMEEAQSVVLVLDYATSAESVHVKSQAVLLALRELGGLWALLSGLRLVPRPMRDVVYDWVVRHRYRWFGRFDACKVPAPEVAGRFLE